jgi:two-component sensor histidine kinase
MSASPEGDDTGFAGSALPVGGEPSRRHHFRHGPISDKEFLDLALAAGRLGTWQIDLETATISGSRSFWEMFGLQEADVVPFEDLRSRVYPADWESFCAAAMPGMTREFESEVRVRQPNRGLRWVALRGSEETRNHALLRIGVAADVTERRGAALLKALAKKRALVVRELGHRLANLFPVLTALVNLVDTPEDDVECYKRALLSRIRALEHAHLIVSRSGSGVATLRDLVVAQIIPYRDVGGVSIEGPQVLVSDGAAESFSIIVHELAINSVKHGALGQPSGNLAVGWYFCKSELTREVVFEWVETGSPPAESEGRKGFGSSIVGFDGNPLIGHSSRIEFRDGGLTYSLRIPLEAIAPRRRSERSSS